MFPHKLHINNENKVVKQEISIMKIHILKLLIPLKLLLKVSIVKGKIVKDETFIQMSLYTSFLESSFCTNLIAIGVEAAPNPNKLAVKLAHNSSKVSSLLILYSLFKIGLKRKLIDLINLESIDI